MNEKASQRPLTRGMELDEYIRILDSEREEEQQAHGVAMWDQRADEWEKEYNDPTPQREKVIKSDDRIQIAVEMLESYGLLGSDCEAADIGCGPGRFAVAFARTARHVTGIDLSERMVQYGREYAARENMENVSFLVRDFQTMDIDQEGLAGKFDLVFCSTTPAVRGMKGLEKTIQMSRKYCCHINHLRSENALEQQIMQELFDRDRPDPWSKHKHMFQAMFNTLFLLGYYPEATYNHRFQEKAVRFTPERIRIFMRQMLPLEEQTEANINKLTEWVRTHADEDGWLIEESDMLYGRLVWDVREKAGE